MTASAERIRVGEAAYGGSRTASRHSTGVLTSRAPRCWNAHPGRDPLPARRRTRVANAVILPRSRTRGQQSRSPLETLDRSMTAESHTRRVGRMGLHDPATAGSAPKASRRLHERQAMRSGWDEQETSERRPAWRPRWSVLAVVGARPDGRARSSSRPTVSLAWTEMSACSTKAAACWLPQQSHVAQITWSLGRSAR